MADNYEQALGDVGRPIRMMAVESLLPADSPRLEGLNEDHAQALADSGTEFEPILVHREEGRVVDGMHRLRATILRGERYIAVRYIDGPAADLFVRAVQANINHGLPLTLRDRKAAVVRILATHPQWSDRAIAAVAGVSPKTVGAARRRLSTEEHPHSNASTARVGMDGRLRPLDMRQRREKARCLLAEHPGLTLREVAQEAGVSISTAHRLRQELHSCRAFHGPAEQPAPHPVVPLHEESQHVPRLVLAASQQEPDLTSIPHPRDPLPEEHASTRIKAMDTLINDPSIRFTDSGRALLRWLNGQARGLAVAEQLLEAVPPHCAKALAEVANHYARNWGRLALELQEMDRASGYRRVAR